MDSKIYQHMMDEKLNMLPPSGGPLEVTATNFIFGDEDGEVIDSRMIIRVSPEVYARIDSENLFNLTPDVRGPLFGGSFEPGKDIEIEMALDADILDGLLEHADEVKEAASYLVKLSHDKKEDPLLETGSWYGLYVKQEVDLPPDIGEGTLKVGYKTTWAAEMEPPNDEPHAGSLEEMVVDYLLDDGWSLYGSGDSDGFYTQYEGSNGKWTCFGHTREEEQQFIFYSLAPVTVPAEHKQAMVEFVTRANYGLPVGNFEMNWDSGEVRYKTSIDVEDVELSAELVRHVVEANISTMDFYLPGIQAVINGDPAADAIASVEG